MTKPKKKKIKKEKTFAQTADRFIEKTEALKIALVNSMQALNNSRNQSQENLNKLIKKGVINVLEKKGSKIFFSASAKDYQLVADFFEKRTRINTAMPMVPIGLFILLVCEYENFIREVLLLVFYSKIEVLNSSQINLNIADILKHETISEIKERVINQEIDSILRKNSSDQIKWFIEKIGVNGDDLEEKLLKSLIEITARRNLFVHTNGVISSEYLTICKKSGIALEKDFELGRELFLSPEYFYEAIRIITHFSIELMQLTWRKITPEDNEKADDSLLTITYELIRQNKNTLAARLLEFANKKIIKTSSEETKLYFLINHALALKHGKQEGAAMKLINSQNWKAKDAKFRLAAAVIKNEYSIASSCMLEIGKRKGMNEAYKTWPLFNTFRNREEFQNAYKKVFNEVFKFRSDETLESFKKK